MAICGDLNEFVVILLSFPVPGWFVMILARIPSGVFVCDH